MRVKQVWRKSPPRKKWKWLQLIIHYNVQNRYLGLQLPKIRTIKLSFIKYVECYFTDYKHTSTIMFVYQCNQRKQLTQWNVFRCAPWFLFHCAPLVLCSQNLIHTNQWCMAKHIAPFEWTRNKLWANKKKLNLPTFSSVRVY